MSKSKQNSSSVLSVKEPWLAVNLSLFFPGIGQFYTGNIARGCFLILIQLGLYGLSIGLIFSSTGNIILGSLVLGISLCFSVWTIFDSYQCAEKINHLILKKRKKRVKDPWFAVFLSRLIPGVGHLYMNKVWLSILLFTFFVSSLLVDLVPILLKSLIAYHVYIESPIGRKAKKINILIICIFSVIMSIMIAIQLLFIKSYIAEPYSVFTSSMTPILQRGDRVLVDKYIYRLHSPQRGDIVLFFPTATLQKQNFQEILIKRVIGLPGEAVEIQGGTVYINHQPLEENYIKNRVQSHSQPITVPPNSYLVLGDNRTTSYDSLDWGLVPRPNIRGKISKRLWPLQRMGEIR